MSTLAFSHTPVKEFEFDASSYQHGDWVSPVTTFNGSIYAVWTVCIDDDLGTMIAKKDRNGAVTTNIVLDSTIKDFHGIPSVGVSPDGYIFVAGNMHNHPWCLRRSEYPEDISSFISATDRPPGHNVSYPYFATDRNGDLYLTSRSQGHAYGGMICVYERDTQTWRPLGQPPGSGTVPFVFFQSPVAGYVSYKTRLFFDPSNRMHVSTVIWTKYGNADGRARAATHILYAYSDDGGRSFKKADGQSISPLPVTIDNGTVVYQEEPGTIYNFNDVSALPDGTPLVTYENNNGTNLMILKSDGSWKRIASANRVLVDNNGVMTYSVRGQIRRSADRGITWVGYSAPVGRASIYDVEYTAQTNNIRYSQCVNGKFEVYTIYVNADTTDG